ncbi:MAG: penicillin-binding protein 2 [Anaerolineales bacterium]
MNLPKFWRYQALGLAFVFFGIMLIGQIYRIQHNVQAQALIEKNQIYLGEERTVQPVRGQVYDRSGNLLAGNQTVYQVGVELKLVKNPETIALALNVVLGLDYAEMLDLVSLPATDQRVYRVVQDFVSADKVQQLRQFAEQIEAENEQGLWTERETPPSLRGLVYSPHLQRHYPEKDLAANLIGFANRESQGHFGIEEKYQDLLYGTPQKVWFANDPNLVNVKSAIPAGASIILTIDREIQLMVEEILDAAVINTGSESGTVIVMQPETGEILAMATTPRIDLNEYWNYGAVYPAGTPFNRAVSQTYEPGSVFKVLTMAAALDSGTVKPDTPFLDTGVFEIGGIYIRNWNGGAWGPQDMTGCMRHSLNVCLAWIATELGPTRFYDYMRAFGIGHLTGIDLAAEAAGRLKIPGDADWYEADLATNSFGQGVSTTPIQMIAAVAAVANDGKMPVPHVLKAVIDRGRQYDTNPQIYGAPISAETAHTLTEMLAISLEEESSAALVPGYRVAGKTGTAQIPTPNGYTLSQTNASFVGWGPVDNPQFIVYVWLEKPSTDIWGSVVAAPVFSQIVQRLVVLMQIPPDEVRVASGQ